MTPRTDVKIAGFRRAITLTAIIDTGFDGDLCIPIETAATLGLELAGSVVSEFADGSVKRELVFKGQAEFMGRTRDVEISLTESEDCLLGTLLLSDCQLLIDFGTGEVRLSESAKKPSRKSKK